MQNVFLIYFAVGLLAVLVLLVGAVVDGPRGLLPYESRYGKLSALLCLLDMIFIITVMALRGLGWTI